MTREVAIEAINEIINYAEDTITEVGFIEALELAKASIKTQCEIHPQRQDGLTYQLKDLVCLANVHGMYDAADWLNNAMSTHNPISFYKWNEFKKRTVLIGEIKALRYSINSDDLKIINAKIHWCYNTSSGFSEDFEFSQLGYENACNWIERKRIELIRQLL